MSADPWKLTAAQAALMESASEHRVKGEALHRAVVEYELWALQHPDEAKKAKTTKRQKRRSMDNLKALHAKNKPPPQVQRTPEQLQELNRQRKGLTEDGESRTADG